MILALPREGLLDRSSNYAARKSFKSQAEHSCLDVFKSSALKYVKKNDSVIVCVGEFAANQSNVGVMNESLHDLGCKNVAFLIESEKLIKSIKRKMDKRGQRANIVRGSLLRMGVNLDAVNVVIDICSTQHFCSEQFSNSKESDANTVFENVTQILKDGGRYLCMMDAEEGIIDKMLSYFKENWFIRVQCFQLSVKSTEKSLEVYSPFSMLTLTKLKIKLPKPVLEIATRTDKAKRVDGSCDIRNELSFLWGYSYLQKQLRKEIDTDNGYVIDFWYPKSNSESPRYTVHIIDSEKDKLTQQSGEYGVFIVPFGREISWLFASDKGRRNLATMAGFERLAVISTYREHSYGNLDDIQQELSSKVLQLAPPHLKASAKVPFLTVGNDVGKREIVFESGSAFDGYVVEDVKMDDGYCHRRLVFKKSPTLVQSEFRILNDTVKNGLSLDQRIMDPKYLATGCHRRMLATLSYIRDVNLESPLKILLIGLGGGALPTFIANTFTNVTVVCVELDSQIVDIAKTWFSLRDDSTVKTVIADGLEFMLSEIERGMSESYDAILFDVNTDDDSMAITAPPVAFLEDAALENVKQLLKPSGVFTINFLCRDVELRMKTINDLKFQFKHAEIVNGDSDELNVIVLCLPPGRQHVPSNAECLEVLSKISEKVSGDCSSDPFDFCSILERSSVV